jgi:polysaccharide pyruvyl transferase WcaK-like protein
MGGYTQNNMFGLKVDYRQLVVSVIDHLICQKGVSVLLVPHVFGTKKHDESDSAVSEHIYAELKQKYKKKLYMVRGNYNQSEIKYVIGFCDLFIGSRMHACIAALSQNIPTVGIAYSRKFTGVFRTIGAASYVADPRKLKNENILALIDLVYEQRVSIQRKLEQTMPKVKETVLELFNEIMSVV